ncbi:MAG: tyrosine-type recombinase/integrase [Alloalcanivorax venustensis]
MPLHLRRRKNSPNWYIYGTVKVGKETRQVEEYSTGRRQKRDAQEFLDRETQRIQDELIHGPAGRAKHITFEMCASAYIWRPEGLHRNDIWRVGELGKWLEGLTLPEIKKGWNKFVEERCAGLAPSTVNRFRDTLQAALNYGCEREELVAPKIARVKFQNERVRYLTIEEQERLLAAYSPHARPIATMLCFQGCRTQEALQLDWRDVDFDQGTVFYRETKNGDPRTVAMHGRVATALAEIFNERERPVRGHVFLNRMGEPYADTRTYKMPGGNPIRRAHEVACRRAGIENFRPHDWRHHACCWWVMKGVPLPTIQKLGGWKTITMVMRYASVSTEHMDDAMRRMG